MNATTQITSPEHRRVDPFARWLGFPHDAMSADEIARRRARRRLMLDAIASRPERGLPPQHQLSDDTRVTGLIMRGLSAAEATAQMHAERGA